MTTRATILVALLCLVPSAARAVTVADIIGLSKAGVTADILLAVIDADRTIFTLTAEDILALKDAGVPSQVIVKMLGSQQEFGHEAPPPLIVGVAPPPPVTVVVPAFVALPFFVPVPVGLAPPHRRVPSGVPRGFGRFMNDGWIEGRGFGRFINTP